MGFARRPSTWYGVMLRSRHGGCMREVWAATTSDGQVLPALRQTRHSICASRAARATTAEVRIRSSGRIDPRRAGGNRRRGSCRPGGRLQEGCELHHVLVYLANGQRTAMLRWSSQSEGPRSSDWIERRFPKPQVACSTHAGGTTFSNALWLTSRLRLRETDDRT